MRVRFVTAAALVHELTGAELLLENISQRYGHGSIIITSNQPFDERTETSSTERLTHHAHYLETNGASFRLRESQTSKTNKRSELAVGRGVSARVNLAESTPAKARQTATPVALFNPGIHSRRLTTHCKMS